MRFVATIAVIAVFASGTPSLAQDAAQPDTIDADRDAEAQLRFRAGRSAYTDERYDDALEHFRAAYTLSPRDELLFNIGQAAEKAGQVELAIEYFESYLEADPNGAKADEIRVRLPYLRQLTSGTPTPEETAQAGIEGERTTSAAAEEGSSNAWVWVLVAVAVVLVGVGVGVGIALGTKDSQEPLIQADAHLEALWSR